MDQDRDERIRTRAHEIWEREGRQEGTHDANWQRAERELASEVQDGPSPSDAAVVPQPTSADGTAGGAARRKR